MNKLIILSSLLILLLCCNKEDRPEVLYIAGTITDKIDDSPIPDAQISIVRSVSVSIEIIDTTLISDVNGQFECEIIPVDDFPYHLSIVSIGHKQVNLDIDRDKENNVFTIELERF